MNWGQCRELLFYELKHTPVYFYIGNVLMAGMMGWVFAQILLPLMIEREQTTIIVDSLLVVGISVNAYLFRPYSYFLREIKSGFYVAPLQVLLRQMPIDAQTIIISRLVMTLILSFGTCCIFLMTLYFSLPKDHLASVFPNYLFFSLVWLLLTLSLAGGIAAAEPGASMTKSYITIWWGMVFVGFVGGSLLLKFFTGLFIFEWLLESVAEWPVLSLLVVFLLTVLILLAWAKYMRRYMKSTDYHV
ncbi:hypothetical protein [Shouchella shacheensis]|uniref:hypothetical protein n=1 Tax=Shouchella shacheensis TaxID=1649580 RepID=UPI0007404908|nr:hypothetical protein [Shouchella shacheensis]